MKPEELKLYIENSDKNKILRKSYLGNNGLILEIDNSDLIEITMFLKEDKKLQCKILIDIFAKDNLSEIKRFELTYNLLSLKFNFRIMLKLMIDDEEPVNSLVELYPAANWFERECWDMYGIEFDNHPDMRRILTDYGFNGYPLRKDFPLMGYVEVHYDHNQQKVIYDNVKLPQDFRNFDFISPWEGTNYILAGDEKASK